MGKSSLNDIQQKVDSIIARKREEFRGEVNLLSHKYRVSSTSFTTQLKKQLEKVRQFSPLTDEEYNKKLEDLSKIYTKELRNSLKLAGCTFNVSDTRTYVASITASEKSNRNIFGILQKARRDPLDTLRTNLVKDIFDSYRFEDKYFDYSNLSKEELIEIRDDVRRKTRRTVSVGSDIDRFEKLESTIFGFFSSKSEKVEKDSNGNIVRNAGLSHLGHVKASAVNQRVIPKLANDIIEGTIEKELIEAGISVSVSSAFKNTATSAGLVKLGSKTFDIVVEVFDESARYNLGDASTEKARVDKAVKKITKVLYAELKKEDWYNQEGSSSFMKAVQATILNSALTEMKKVKGIKVTGKPIKLDLTASKTTPSKSKSVTRKLDTKGSKTSVAITSPTTVRESKSANKVKNNNNWLQLLPVINSKLNDRVMKNMGSPRLNNRTGRLAQSAKVVNVEQTPQGLPSFIFDYERNPYDVFDRTKGAAPWNTPQRDPRALVDQSVREIVREMAIGRFFTRRA